MEDYLFYQYSLYTLEHKYAEIKTVDHLENEESLCRLVEPFFIELAHLLFNLLQKGEVPDISKLEIPELESKLQKILKENFYYKIYSTESSGKALSETVLNKFLSRLFKNDGRNGENFIIQNHLHSWLEKRLAKSITQDERFSSMSILIALVERSEMLHNFYIYLKDSIPKEWILNNKTEWTAVYVDPENILESVRTFDRDYFTHYLEHLALADKSSLFNYISDAIHGSDYAMLHPQYAFKCDVLLQNDLEIWLEFWDKLKLPVIQDCVFHSSFTPDKYLELFEVIASQRIKTESDSKLLMGIAAKNYFDASIKITEQLSLYNEDERINDLNRSFFEDGKKCNREWLEKKKHYYNIIIKQLQTCLAPKETEDWIFSYKPKINNSNKFISIYNDEIELLTKTFKTNDTMFTGFSTERLNLQKFNFYADIIKESDDKPHHNELLDAILNYIESDSFYWDKSFSEMYLSSLRGIAYLISLDSDPEKKADDIINRFKINYQGWKPDKIDYKIIPKEAFIYCAVALLFEKDSIWKTASSSNFFEKFTAVLLSQTKYSIFSSSDDYETSLIILFQLVSKIQTDQKEKFEMKLMKNYDNFYSLLFIFASNNIPITEHSKVLLEKMAKKEVPLIKRQFSNRKQRDKVFSLEQMIEKLNLDI